MKFTIKNTTLQAGAPPEIVTRLRECLDGLPDGELLPYLEVKARFKVGKSHAREAKKHPLLTRYWTLALVQGVRMVLFGNHRTITAYNKEFKA